jgi:predicted aspartyl protease
MKIRLQNGLPYTDALLTYQGQHLSLENVLLDTGSAGVIFSTDRLLTIGLQYAPEDMAHRIRGVGGAEFVFTKRIDRLTVGELQVDNFEIEVGAMDYGFEIEGILGMDFLIQVGAVIDLAKLEVYSA